MIELPEARIIARDLKKTILNKKIANVVVKQSPHNFAFIEGDGSLLVGKKVTGVNERNYYVEFACEDYTVALRDGALIRYYENESMLPKKHQFLIEFDDKTFLVVTVAMYAFIGIFKTGKSDNKYYLMELSGVSPLDKKFNFDYFKSLLNEDTSRLSSKAFLATEQRILGIGNGIVQDILYNAKIHPKRKMNTLTDNELKLLYDSIITTIDEMIKNNGRDVEKNIFGEFGGYQTKLSKNTVNIPCSKCKDTIKKEAYLGGSIYYCPTCQKMIK